MKKKASYRDLALIAGNIGKLYDEGISLLNILNLIDELPLWKGALEREEVYVRALKWVVLLFQVFLIL